MIKKQAPRPLSHPGGRWLAWFLPITFLLGVSQACAQPGPGPARRVTLTIHPERKQQAWEGFGASGAGYRRLGR